MKRRNALKLIRYAKKATKAIAVVDGIGWMILVTLLDPEPPIGDIVMKYFILTMAILILCLVQMEILDRIKNSLNASTPKGTNKIRTIDMIPKKGRKINGNTLRDGSRIYDSFRYGGGSRRGSLQRHP